MKLTRSFAVIAEENVASVEESHWLEWSGLGTRLGWDELLKSSRVFIISQAGAGKTHECKRQKKLLQAAGSAAFFLELSALCNTDVQSLLEVQEEKALAHWKQSQEEVATFFLDAFDELALTHGNFRTALMKLRRVLGSDIARTRIVITSRPVKIDRDTADELLAVPKPERNTSQADAFADLALGETTDATEDCSHKWRIVKLLPFSTDEMHLFATGQGVADPENLIREINRKGIKEFAERPQDLIELCSQWREFGRLGTHREQVGADIRSKLNVDTASRELADLSYERALDGAGRLALAAILMRRLSFRHGAAPSGGGEEFAIDLAGILPDWSSSERSTLLQRALFGVASYGRVRFHHRSVIEYLAAERLSRYLDSGKPVTAIRRVLFAETAQGHRVVRPTMQSVAAWLAARSTTIFTDICERDPSVILDFGDPQSLTDNQKIQALSAYIKRYGKGGWQGIHVPAMQIRRFATPALSGLIRMQWPTVENPDVRNLLLNLITAGRCDNCADIAFDVASDLSASRNLRLSALDALAELGDSRMANLTRSMETDAVAWPNEITRSAISILFPTHLGIGQLVNLLQRLTEPSTSIGNLNYYLPQLILEKDFSHAELGFLRLALTILVGFEFVPDEHWPPCKAERPFLLPPLAATCTRLVKEGVFDQGLAASIIMALRVAGHDFESNQVFKTLRVWISTADGIYREKLFWTDDALSQARHFRVNPIERFFQVQNHGSIKLTQRDEAWVLETLSRTKRPIDERAVTLVAAMQVCWDGAGAAQDRAQFLHAKVKDSPELSVLVEKWMVPVPISDERQQWDAAATAQAARQKIEVAKARGSWKRFWKELAEMPDAALSEARAFDTAWSLWNAMSRRGQRGRSSGWDRAFLEENFGKTVTDRIREMLGPIWRSDEPTFRSEREFGAQNTMFVRWQLGLAALWAEAEDPDWAKKLTAQEACLACRYVQVQLNGFPAWLDDLAVSHAIYVEAILGRELDHELREAIAPGVGDPLLCGIVGASEVVAQLFVPRLRAWLVDEGVNSNVDETGRREGRLRKVVSVLLKVSCKTEGQLIYRLATEQLSSGLDCPMSKVWLPILLDLDPEAGVIALGNCFRTISSSGNRVVAEWVAALFDTHSSDGFVRLHAGFTPNILLRLLEIVYLYIRPEDDARHEGSWVPDTRDRAEHGRNSLLSALLGATGQTAWVAKLELANKPFAAHMRDRVLAMARKQSAREVDGEAQDAEAVIALERRGEMPPKTRQEMFQLLVDRLGEIQDSMSGDESPREGWAVWSKERIMRRALASALKGAANGAYIVHQEAVTADEKETDIRLVSTSGSQQAVIELKIGDNGYSVADLLSALEGQLIGKYMAPECRKAGCLLVTIAKKRTWQNPKDSGVLEFSDLIKLLDQRARDLMIGVGGTISVTVRGLDLRPVL